MLNLQSGFSRCNFAATTGNKITGVARRWDMGPPVRPPKPTNIISIKMNIANLIEAGQNVQFVITAVDLKEFALALIDETKATTPKPKRERAYTPTEFAKKHNVDKSTLWRWCKAGILTPTRIGGKVFYFESSLINGGPDHE